MAVAVLLAVQILNVRAQRNATENRYIIEVTRLYGESLQDDSFVCFFNFSNFYLSLSWQPILDLPISLWKGPIWLSDEKKRILCRCCSGHVTVQLNQLLHLAYYASRQQLLLQIWKQHRNTYRHLGTRAAYAAAPSRKDVSRTLSSVAVESESQTLELPWAIIS